MRSAILCLASTLLLAPVPSAAQRAQKAPPSQLVITSATFDAQNEVLSIVGQNFGDQPAAVALELVPLQVLNWTDTQVQAVLSAATPPGTYLLTVSRGPSATDLGVLHVTMGAVGPPGPQGPPGIVPGATTLGASLYLTTDICDGQPGLMTVTPNCGYPAGCSTASQAGTVPAAPEGPACRTGCTASSTTTALPPEMVCVRTELQPCGGGGWTPIFCPVCVEYDIRYTLQTCTTCSECPYEFLGSLVK